ncbi:MAG: gamma-glutamyl-gamma-aminobutyrate hydrolase family protein [Rickettsiales bacterium]|jgi:putative glutamine amidotransferase|nr:gamma-glutamyl-gamma-aminobutyrate hydrolase family protein [Rickettsiales bacterium]
MKNSPIIGVTLDFEQGGKPGNFSKMPHYAVRQNYCTAVSDLGAVVLPLPHDLAAVPTYLDLIDGLIITGGGFDVPPEYYGEAVASDKVTTKDARTAFEFAITRGMIEARRPVLGICGGEQLLNVVLGGTLIQHIPDAIANALEHEQKNARTEPGHGIEIAAGTLLHRITGTLQADVNTAHHQAVGRSAPGVVVNARSADGVIEGIELPSHPFCLGVQWHPEYFVSPIDKRIFEAFVEACKGSGSEGQGSGKS